MTMDFSSAEKIVTAMQSASNLCNQSLVVVKTHEPLGQVDTYGKLVASFMANCYLNLLAPIWKTIPALRPAEMDQPCVPGPPPLSTESKAAMLAFMAVARDALNTIRPLLPVPSDASLPNQGGLPEIEQSLLAIEAFLNASAPLHQ